MYSEQKDCAYKIKYETADIISEDENDGLNLTNSNCNEDIDDRRVDVTSNSLDSSLNNSLSPNKTNFKENNGDTRLEGRCSLSGRMRLSPTLNMSGNCSVLRTRRRKAGISDDQKLCAVCSEHATGYNFDQLTCESCKAFFRRNAVKPADKIKSCSKNRNCQIFGSQRKHCPACRLEKCYQVGMKKELILPPEKLETRAKPKRRKMGSDHENESIKISNLSQNESINQPSSSMKSDLVVHQTQSESYTPMPQISANQSRVQAQQPIFVGAGKLSEQSGWVEMPNCHQQATILSLRFPTSVASGSTLIQSASPLSSHLSLLIPSQTSNNAAGLSSANNKPPAGNFVIAPAVIVDSGCIGTTQSLKLYNNHGNMILSPELSTDIQRANFPTGILMTDSVSLAQNYPLGSGHPQIIYQTVSSSHSPAVYQIPPRPSLAPGNQPTSGLELVSFYSAWSESISTLRDMFFKDSNSVKPTSNQTSIPLHELLQPIGAEDLCNQMDHIIRCITNLAKYIPGFRELPYEYQANLVKKNVFGLMLVVCSFLPERDTPLINLCKMSTPRKEAHDEASVLYESNKTKLWAVTQELEKVTHLDDHLRVCLFALRLFSPDSDFPLEMCSYVRQNQMEVMKFTRKHLTYLASKILGSNVNVPLCYSRLILALAHCRPHEARLRAFTEVLRSDKLIPLIRDFFNK